jgi:hypothetical protein
MFKPYNDKYSKRGVQPFQRKLAGLLLRRKSRSTDGVRRLTLGWFTEGFDTRDLKEAKALLHALAS